MRRRPKTVFDRLDRILPGRKTPRRLALEAGVFRRWPPEAFDDDEMVNPGGAQLGCRTFIDHYVSFRGAATGSRCVYIAYGFSRRVILSGVLPSSRKTYSACHPSNA